MKKKDINFNLSTIADGGMWKNEAIRNIKEYLVKKIGNPDGIKASILG